MRHWLTKPLLPDDEWVGRQLKNAFDVEETVVMQVKHWKYFDWLAERGSDMEQWVKDADMARHKEAYTMSLSTKMCVNLFHSEKRRYLSGKQCPLFISPNGYSK